MLSSMMARLFAVVVLLVTAASGAAHAQNAERRREPLVIELYTSQGCFECPRANRLIGQFTREPDVLALTLPVGYWDYLGWRDTFAKPEFTTRQRVFARALRVRGLMTPQLIFNGERSASAADWDAAQAILEEMRDGPAAAGAPDIDIRRVPGGRVRVTVSNGARYGAPADVWSMSYEPGPITVYISEGENARRRINHYNLVNDIRHLGTWNGAAAYFERPRCIQECAVLVQAPNGGPIIAAAFTRNTRR